jgi:predicted phage terminase large subunit-like protein
MDDQGNIPKEAFYGGAGGGGKSHALLMAAAQYVEVPGYAAIILRRRLVHLQKPGALIPRSKSWWKRSRATWNAKNYEWTFPSGATISFGYLETDDDLEMYQGAEFQFIGFDEATQFPFHHYRFMFSRLRKSASIPVPLRIRCASNPGGVGHDWVKDRFIINGLANGRPFVPASVHDNPSLDIESYINALQELDPITRAQILEGDWNARHEASFFNRNTIMILPDAPVSYTASVRHWDLATTAPSPLNPDPDYIAGVKMVLLPNGLAVITSVVRDRLPPGEAARLVQATAIADGPDTIISIEQEPGASGVMLVEDWKARLLSGFTVVSTRATGPKTARAASLASAMHAGNVAVTAAPWLSAFLDELDAFPNGPHDDQVDAAAGAYHAIARLQGIREASPAVASLFDWQAA